MRGSYVFLKATNLTVEVRIYPFIYLPGNVFFFNKYDVIAL